MESIWAAYGDGSPQPASCNNTDVVHDDYRSGEDNASPNGSKTDVVHDDYLSGGNTPSEEEQFVKHAKFDENVLKRKNDCVYDHYYSGEDEPSEEDRSMRDARFDKALLNFYVKNKVKQLKRKLTSSRFDMTPISHGFKRKKIEISETTTFTRYSGTYFSSVLKLLTPHQRSVIIKYGAECMLKIEKTDVPLRFVKWVAGKFDTRTSEIQVNKQFVPVTKETIHKILELPIGGLELIPDSRAGRSFILSHFNVTCVPQVSFFGNKLNSDEQLSDEDIFICFMYVAFQCFLCPNSSLQPSTEYLHIFRDPNNVMKYDLCKYVYDWLISSIKKFQKATKRAARRQITLGGNHYSLAVAYLDSVEFGLNSLPDVVPRALVWKGSRIRKYAELDKCSGNSYGKRPLKRLSYASKIQVQHEQSTMPNVHEPEDSFASKLKSMFSFCLNDQQIDRIDEIVQISNTGESKDSQKLCENVVCDVLKTIYASNQHAKSAYTDGFAIGNSTHYHSETICRTPLAKASGNENRASSTSTDDNLTISRGKLASGKYQQLSKILDSRDDAYVPQDTNKDILHDISGPTDNVPNIQESGPTKAEVTGNIVNIPPATQACPIDIIDSQELNSVPPMKKVKPKCSDFSIRNKNLNSSNYVNAPEPNALSPIIPITLVHLFHENQASKDQPIELINRNNSGPSQGCIFTTPAARAIVTQDVQITAVRNFDQRCNTLSKQASDAYNKLVLCTNSGNKQVVQNTILIESPVQKYIQISPTSEERQDQSNVRIQNIRPTSKQLEADLNLRNNGEPGSSSHSNHVFVPTRVTMPGRYTCMPYVSQVNRYPVSNSERRHYSAMCQIGEHKDWKKMDAVKYDKAYCSFDSLASLQPFGHVDNYVILVYCRKLFLDNHPVASRRHCFFSYIGETILKYNGNNGEIVQGAFIGANKALKLWRSDQLTFPICLDEHWFTFVVCLKAKYFAFLDSLYSKNSDFHRQIDPILIQNFVILWDMFVTPLMTHPINFRQFQTIHPAVPRQNNTDDCGIFTAKIMEVWHPRVNLQNVISADDILNLRIKLANELFFAKYNTIDKTIVSEFFGDVGM